MRRTGWSLVLAAVLAIPLAACVSGVDADEAKAGQAVPMAGAKVETALITGVVVDTELVPIAKATVTATPGNLSTTTNNAGEFNLGPFDPGTYSLTAEKDGYAGKAVMVEVTYEESVKVILALELLPSNAPYHETKTYASYMLCQVSINYPPSGGPNVPCSTGLLDYVAGVSSVDKVRFPFEISDAGFRQLIVEAQWQKPNTAGPNCLLWIRAPQSDGSYLNYFRTTSSSPLWGEVKQGIVNAGGGAGAVFVPKPGEKASYEFIFFGAPGNETIPPYASLWVEFRAQIFFTFFYNGAAPQGFAIIPK